VPKREEEKMARQTDGISSLFELALAKPRETGISAVEQLMSQFEGHERQEMEFIERYKEIIDGHPDALVKFLLQLIISDEEKHHSVVRSMASWLKGDLTWASADQRAANLGEITREEKEELLNLTSIFIKEENDTIREYKSIIDASKGYYGGLFTLLIETIVHDSQKHIKILKFLEKRLKKS
jgi:rubrerythrin